MGTVYSKNSSKMTNKNDTPLGDPSSTLSMTEFKEENVIKIIPRNVDNIFQGIKKTEKNGLTTITFQTTQKYNLPKQLLEDTKIQLNKVELILIDYKGENCGFIIKIGDDFWLRILPKQITYLEFLTSLIKEMQKYKVNLYINKILIVPRNVIHMLLKNVTVNTDKLKSYR